MAIKPIDFQVMMPKTSEVSKINSHQTQSGVAFQQHQASSVQRKAESDVRQVHTQDGVHQAKVQEKQEKNQKEEGKGNREQKKNKNTGKGRRKPYMESESIIDVRI